jgi:hypothetical protein
MSTRTSSSGTFSSMGRALDESMQMAMDMREGRISRAEFERWYSKRREEGRQVMVTLRDGTMDMAGKPVEMVLDFGQRVLEMSMPRARARPRGRVVKRRMRRARRS